MSRSLVSINMTSFFHRELFMYSIGDIKFKKPIALKKVAYTTAFLIVWTIPMIVIFGFQLNVFFMGFAVIPPFFFGHWASKPMFQQMSLPAFIKTINEYITTPKGWTDLEASNDENGECVYQTESQIWISRRRELQALADLRELKVRGINNEA